MNQETQQTGQGDCFQANFDWLLRYPGHRGDRSIRLCHGKVIGAPGSPVEGKAFAHCWLELNGHVLDFSNGRAIAVPKDILTKKGRILEETVRRYTFDQAAKLCLKHKHYGPWDPALEENT